jgi:hypothetical protein
MFSKAKEETVKGKDYLKIQGIDEKIILQWIYDVVLDWF